eukprot:m51a1_g6473 hypothetical protein (226) ;mRNA; f:71040-71717
MGKTALGFALVLYDSADPLGPAAAAASSLHLLVLPAILGSAVARRDLRALHVLAAAALHELLCAALKAAAADPRPAGCEKTDYGMPSSHALLWAYLATLAARPLLAPRDPLAWRCLRGRGEMAALSLRAAGAAAAAAAVAWSRVRLGYHTPRQVAAGLALGALLGAAWESAGAAALRARVSQWAERTRAARSAGWCDLSGLAGLERAHAEATDALRRRQVASRGR